MTLPLPRALRALADMVHRPCVTVASPYGQALPDGFAVAVAGETLSADAICDGLAGTLRRAGLPRHAEDLLSPATRPLADALHMALHSLPSSSPQPSPLHTLADASAEIAWVLSCLVEPEHDTP